MSIVHLKGTIPVTVVVDTDEGDVVKVVADDEGFEYAIDFRGKTIARASVRPQEAEIDKALDIADEAVWPAWEWGW